MELLVNDLSLHGQFEDIDTFRRSIARMLAIRKIAQRFGRALHCHRSMAHAKITKTMTMPQAVQCLSLDERRILLHWITQNGPFWEDARNHGGADWLEWNGEIVTDTALGEAGWCQLNSISRELVSFLPSNWKLSPISVKWVIASGNVKTVDIQNYWEPSLLERVLQSAPVPVASWAQLENQVRAKCTNLTFSHNSFLPLEGHPFGTSPAFRILFILETLNQLKSCFDQDGRRTPEGHKIYQDFFTGKKGDGGRGPLFTDSSETEKTQFQAELTFIDPSNPGKELFCPWHGKVQTPQLRVHFSYPVRVDSPLYIMYVGPKITKR